DEAMHHRPAITIAQRKRWRVVFMSRATNEVIAAVRLDLVAGQCLGDAGGGGHGSGPPSSLKTSFLGRSSQETTVRQRGQAELPRPSSPTRSRPSAPSYPQSGHMLSHCISLRSASALLPNGPNTTRPDPSWTYQAPSFSKTGRVTISGSVIGGAPRRSCRARRRAASRRGRAHRAGARVATFPADSRTAALGWPR